MSLTALKVRHNKCIILICTINWRDSKSHSTCEKVRLMLWSSSFLPCLCEVWGNYSGHQILCGKLCPLSYFISPHKQKKKKTKRLGNTRVKLFVFIGTVLTLRYHEDILEIEVWQDKLLEKNFWEITEVDQKV